MSTDQQLLVRRDDYHYRAGLARRLGQHDLAAKLEFKADQCSAAADQSDPDY